MAAPLQDLSDEKVARAAIQKPREAFEVLFERYRGPIYAHLIRSGAPQDRVDDLFQTVFLKAYRAIWTYREKARFRTWLYTIATNVLRDEWRRAGRQGPVVSLEGVAVPDEGRSGREAEQNEATALVRRAIQALPEPSRTLFLLVHYEGMPLAEAGEVVGMKLSATKMSLLRAQRRIGAELAQTMKYREGNHVPRI